MASGKGVYISENEKEAQIAVNEIFDGKFGEAKNLLIEEFLYGEEMSFLQYMTGNVLKILELLKIIKEYLRVIKENTGGMGAYSPSRLINNELEKKIINKIINPTLKGLSELE